MFSNGIMDNEANVGENCSKDVSIKPDPDFHMFGSDGCDLLDMLATVATQTLNSDQSLRAIKTASLDPGPDLKPSTKSRHPRRLTDYDVLSFHQISKMSLNSLVRLFAETDFDEMRRIYRYRCALMPESVCRQTIQSFGNENKAKQLMKSHLQAHIKETLNRDDYLSFTAEPVIARKRRIAECDVEDRPIKTEAAASQVAMEKENSDVIRNNDINSSAKISNKKRNIFDSGVTEGKCFLAEISNEKATAQSKRPRMEMAYYDPNSDMIIQPKFQESNPEDWSNFKRQLKVEEGINRNTPSPEIKLIPYLTSAPLPRVKSEREECVVRMSSFDLDHCYAANFESPTLTQEEYDDDEVTDSDEESSDLSLLQLRQLVDRCRLSPHHHHHQQQNNLDLPLIGAEIEVASSPERPAAPLPEGNQPEPDVPVSAEAERIKEQALKCIQDLQARGATTDDLVCKICNPVKTFTAYTSLLCHFKSHAQIRPFECEKCHTAFTRQHSLNYHMLIHENSTKFTCKICQKKFRHPSHFREHLRRHNGDTPFQCGHCNQRFKTRTTLKRHLKLIHGKSISESGSFLQIMNPESGPRNMSEKSSSGRTVLPKGPDSSQNVINEKSTDNNKNAFKDDFTVEYHYGDSTSNDDEVATISSKVQTKTKTESSYYHSSNSELSSPENHHVAPKLPSFDANPPPGVTGVPMTLKKLPDLAKSVTAVSTSLRLNHVHPKPPGSSDPRPANQLSGSKPAFLAQINGQQVLLIPTPMSDSSTRVLPVVKSLNKSGSPATGQSKLEQCLRYGSAAVSKNSQNNSNLNQSMDPVGISVGIQKTMNNIVGTQKKFVSTPVVPQNKPVGISVGTPKSTNLNNSVGAQKKFVSTPVVSQKKTVGISVGTPKSTNLKNPVRTSVHTQKSLNKFVGTHNKFVGTQKISNTVIQKSPNLTQNSVPNSSYLAHSRFQSMPHLTRDPQPGIKVVLAKPKSTVGSLKPTIMTQKLAVNLEPKMEQLNPPVIVEKIPKDFQGSIYTVPDVIAEEVVAFDGEEVVAFDSEEVVAFDADKEEAHQNDVTRFYQEKETVPKPLPGFSSTQNSPNLFVHQNQNFEPIFDQKLSHGLKNYRDRILCDILGINN